MRPNEKATADFDRRTLLKTAAVGAAVAAPGPVLAQAQSPKAKSAAGEPARHVPTAGGFSKARLQRMHDVMQLHVQGERFPGLVTLLNRRSETVVDTIGTLAFGSSTSDAPRHDLPRRVDLETSHCRRGDDPRRRRQAPPR